MEWKSSSKPSLNFPHVIIKIHYFFAHRYDGFDCLSEIPEACSIDLLKNGVCDEETNSTLCAGDLGACEPDLFGNFLFCLEHPKLQGDGLCDMLNNMKECGFDNGDCVTNQGTYSADF